MFSQTSNTTLQRRPCYATFQSTPTHSLAAQLQQKSCHLTAFLQPFPTCDNHSSGHKLQAAVADMPVSTQQSSSSAADFAMEGQCFACVCPFEEDSEALDLAALKDYLQYLWSKGGRNIVWNGTSGEFAAMSTTERKAALEAAREAWPGVLMNNVSSTCLADVMELLRHSHQQSQTAEGKIKANADAILVLPPYYLAGVSEAGIAAFLRKVLAASRLPVFLYNFPANTSSLISPQMYAALAGEFPVLRGVKNTFEDIPLARQFKAAAPHLQVYVGADKLSVETLENGMDGVIGGGGSSVMAQAFVDIWHAYQSGNKSHAQQLQDRMNVWTAERERLGILDIPAGKAGLALHIPSYGKTCRAPLVQATQQQIDALNKATRTALQS